jgi:hypothetical protein
VTTRKIEANKNVAMQFFQGLVEHWDGAVINPPAPGAPAAGRGPAQERSAPGLR